MGDEPGQVRTALYEAPVHFKNAQGRWVDIDTTLGTSKDGRRSSGANVFDLSIADSSTDKALARLTLDDKHSVGFALDGAAKVKAKADARSVTYAKVHKDTDVRLTSRRSGVKEELVLASPAAPDRFVFPLELKGLTASLGDAGDVIYRDKAGVERARTPHGFMTDANIDPRSQEAPMSLGVTYALVPFKGGTALEVRLDRAWLDDPARVYPVTVDPEIHNTTSGDDTYVMSGFSRDNSYDAELKVGTYDGGAHIGRSYMHFDTSALAGATVQRAELHLAERHSWNCVYWPEHVHRVTQGWNGRDMRDFPGAAVDPTGIGGIWNAGPCGSRDAQWDVTGIAAYWASVRELGGSLSLRATNESDNNRYKKYASTEAGAPPRLDVWYNRPPATASGVTPVNNSVFGTSTTPVSAVYSHPDGVPGQLAFGVWNYQNQLVWSQWSGSLCSGCRATFSPPALPDNWYFVMVIGWDGAQYSGGNAAPTWSPQQWYFIDTLAPQFPSNLTPAAGATAGSPVSVSAVYREPYGFSGRVIFQVNNAAGQLAAPQAVSGYVASGQTATATMAPLGPGSYTIYAWSYDDRQLAGWSGGWAFNVAAKPGAPASIQARGEPASAHVSWGAVASNGSPVSSVTVTARDTVSGTVTTKVCTTCVGNSQMVYDGLTTGRSYQFWAAATNSIGAGLSVGPSNTVQTQELSVLTPRIESVVPGDREVALTWSYLLDLPLVTTFYVQAHIENQSPIGPAVAVPASLAGDLFKASHTYGGLRNGSRVYFTVSANILGLIQSPPATSSVVVPASVPFKPGKPTALPRNEKVILGWPAPPAQTDGTPGNNGATIDSYEVAVLTPPGELVKTVTVSAPTPDTASVSGYEVTELTNLTEYFFKVRAHNAKGFGEYSDPSDTVKPVPAPAPPTGVMASAGNAQATVVWSPPDQSQVPVTRYTVIVYPGERAVQADGGASSKTVTGLTNGTTYTFRVRSSNDSGDGALSEASIAVTPRSPLVPQANDPPIIVSEFKPQPVADGDQHTLEVTSDGRVLAWGRGAFGKLGTGSTTDQHVGAYVADLTSVVGVSAGLDHSLALTSQGQVWAWGRNNLGQLGDADPDVDKWTPVEVPLMTGAVAISAGCNFSLALGSDGSVWSWGDNARGQLGIVGVDREPARRRVPGLSNIVAIAAGCNHAVALDGSGTVYTWGDNQFGQLGNNTTTSRAAPLAVAGLTGVRAIGAGLNHSLVARVTEVLAWGDNRGGQVAGGQPSQSPRTTPVIVNGISNVAAIDGADRHSVALTANGEVWAWGANEAFQLGRRSSEAFTAPVQVLQGLDQNLVGVTYISTGGRHSTAVGSNRKVREWGAHTDGTYCIEAMQKDDPNTSTIGPEGFPIPPPPPRDCGTQTAPRYTYLPLDTQGRARGAEAELRRASVGSGGFNRLTPVGYRGAAGPHDKAHLVAKNLGGSDSNTGNFVTMYDSPNRGAMKSYEGMIAKRLVACELITYTVTPVYQGNDCDPLAINDKGNPGVGPHCLPSTWIAGSTT